MKIEGWDAVYAFGFFVLTSVAMLLPAAVIDLTRRVATRREVAPPNASSTSEPNVAVVLDC